MPVIDTLDYFGRESQVWEEEEEEEGKEKSQEVGSNNGLFFIHNFFVELPSRV